MESKHQEARGENGALASYVKLVRAAESVHSRATRHLASHGLTASQFGALEALHHLGPMCQRDLGLKILRSSGNITMVVDNLEKRGLVRRERDREDRRYITVSLTPDGARLIRMIFPEHAGIVAREMGVLSAQEQAQLGRLCRKVGLGG